MPASAAVTIPIAVAFRQPPLSVILAPGTWLPHTNSSGCYYLNTQPCLCGSSGYSGLDPRLPQDFVPTMANDPIPFYQEYMSWSDQSTSDFALWADSTEEAHEKDLSTTSNRIDDDVSKLPEHQAPEHDDDLMNWQV
ncbi:hypothetical protein PV08_12002 [Exophiala spinifera]|uniref:Uncharacterized protein n=1 Tax=Exophiala spinifera TaxID=91928 RepID=A0A0D2ASM1_9EURO|nr:uncharacterized protein PV08_12002 [Exophiala spinifera]KIW09718.1 hypothetical protein PV08_12002 [Exophiala spinifera]